MRSGWLDDCHQERRSFGRPKILTQQQEQDVSLMINVESRIKSHLAKNYGVSYMVIRRFLDEDLEDASL